MVLQEEGVETRWFSKPGVIIGRASNLVANETLIILDLFCPLYQD